MEIKLNAVEKTIKNLEDQRHIKGNFKDQPIMFLAGRDEGLRMAIKIVKQLNNDNDKIK